MHPNANEKTEEAFYEYIISKSIICYQELLQYDKQVFELQTFHSIRPVFLADDEIVYVDMKHGLFFQILRIILVNLMEHDSSYG